MIDQLAEGLLYLHHTVKLVHNDIEPRHIMCSVGREQALLIDFNMCVEVDVTPNQPGVLYAGETRHRCCSSISLASHVCHRVSIVF
jgi:hypothetical protein